LSFPHDERLVNFGADMRVLKILSSVLLVALLVADTVSVAQEKSSQSATSYVPRLSDIMIVIQIRHSKLFYAVKAKNWPLANFQYEQLVSSLREAERYYPRTLPPMTHVDEIASSLSGAFDELSAGCNRCHMAGDRAFIVIRRPSYTSAFSNQQYTPRPSERQKRGH
jgi:flagellar biosynthesis protein FliQ